MPKQRKLTPRRRGIQYDTAHTSPSTNLVSYGRATSCFCAIKLRRDRSQVILVWRHFLSKRDHEISEADSGSPKHILEYVICSGDSKSRHSLCFGATCVVSRSISLTKPCSILHLDTRKSDFLLLQAILVPFSCDLNKKYSSPTSEEV